MVDEEIERIKEKKLAEMLKKQQEQQIQHETGVIELNSGNFEKTISSQTPTLVDFWAEWLIPSETCNQSLLRLLKNFKKFYLLD